MVPSFCYTLSQVLASAQVRHPAKELPPVDPFARITPEEYAILRQHLIAGINALLGNTDPEASLDATELIAFVRGRCAVCAAKLDERRAWVCPQCGAEQPWVGN